MNLKDFTILNTKSIKEAFSKLEKNKLGIIIIIEKNFSVIGVATDGDIRRYLMENNSINDPILNCTNFKFSSASENSSREKIIKKFDQKIKILPILDSKKRLISILKKDDLPLLEEKLVYSRSKSPVRISFGGGGSDLTNYFSKVNGAVINSTINIYSHASLKLRSDSRIIVNSLDLNDVVECRNLKSFYQQDKKFGLIQSVIKCIKPKKGFELHLYSDYPMGSGLGGSAVVASTILGCFNEFRTDKWNSYELAELAYQAERLYLDISGGWQDQYATIFGGFNFIEFNSDNNIVHPLKFGGNTLKELEENLLLCNTKTNHESDIIHKKFNKTLNKKNIKNLISKNVKLCYEIRNSLLKGDLTNFGCLLDQAWQYKKQLGSGITNNNLNKIYEDAKSNGAIGGKLLGAGGGGFYLFYVDPFKKTNLISFLESSGLEVVPFTFDNSGLKSWTVRYI